MTDETEKEKRTEALLQDLFQKVSSLQQEVTDLKGKDNTQQQSRKRPHNGNSPENQLTREGSDSNPESLIVEDPSLPSRSNRKLFIF